MSTELQFTEIPSGIIDSFYSLVGVPGSISSIPGNRPVEKLQILQDLMDALIFDSEKYAYFVVQLVRPTKAVAVYLEHNLGKDRFDSGMIRLKDWLTRMHAVGDVRTFAKNNVLLYGFQTADADEELKWQQSWSSCERVQVVLSLHKRQRYVENYKEKQEDSVIL